MNFNKKYLKYKSKYKYLKMMGGMEDTEIVHEVTDTEIVHEVTVKINSLGGESEHVLIFTYGELKNPYRKMERSPELVEFADLLLTVSPLSQYTYNVFTKLVKEEKFSKLYEKYEYKIMQGVKNIFDSSNYTLNSWLILDKGNGLVGDWQKPQTARPWTVKPWIINLTLIKLPHRFLPICVPIGSTTLIDELFKKLDEELNKELDEELNKELDNDKSLIYEKEGDVFKLNLKNGLFELFKLLMKEQKTFQLWIGYPIGYQPVNNPGNLPPNNPVNLTKVYISNKYTDGTCEYEIIYEITPVHDLPHCFKTNISFFNNFTVKLIKRKVMKHDPFILYNDEFIQNARILLKIT
jgi:hypothetical protein